MLDDLKDKATEMAGKTTVENPKELFVHNLGATLTMENTVEQMLGKLVDKANGAELKKQLRHHREETQAQIRNLHQVFQSLGMEPQTNPCPAIEGIEQEGEANLKMADESLHDDVILAGCAETEHHEIAVYENLILHANALGHDDVSALLQENLEQEQHTLGEVLKATMKNTKNTQSSGAAA
jgi:ferritin-like metal-binding protein YciE